MKNYEDFELEDFASDDRFIDWCLRPNNKSNSFWANWLTSHPEQQTTINAAKELVLDLHSITAEEQEVAFEDEIWAEINRQTKTQPKSAKIRTLYWTSAVAASIFLIIATYFFWQAENSDNNLQASVPLEWIDLANHSGMQKEVHLPDNSRITLEPFSTLKYPTAFDDDQRTVFLQGEAFFDIARDTTKPFLIFANETVTKVLGTSFRIKAFAGEKTVEVEVKTGKVAVYANVASDRDGGKKKQMIVEADQKILVPQPNKKLEVTPNQKVVFDHQAESLTKTIAALPRIITRPEQLPQFRFQEESIVRVFEMLELAYGIELEYNAEQLEACTITTKLRDEPLLQKLSIICAALNLEFTEKNAIIYITGSGC